MNTDVVVGSRRVAGDRRGLGMVLVDSYGSFWCCTFGRRGVYYLNHHNTMLSARTMHGSLCREIVEYGLFG